MKDFAEADRRLSFFRSTFIQAPNRLAQPGKEFAAVNRARRTAHCHSVEASRALARSQTGRISGILRLFEPFARPLLHYSMWESFHPGVLINPCQFGGGRGRVGRADEDCNDSRKGKTPVYRDFGLRRRISFGSHGPARSVRGGSHRS